MSVSRREYLKYVFTTWLIYPLKGLADGNNLGNFYYIYSRDELRDTFLNFYKNVFHLYPEQEIHDLIARLTHRYKTDELIYNNLQTSLSEIKPFLANLRYALPALAQQKKIMTQQTVQLLGDRKHFDGYLEVGSTGRYIGSLEHPLEITGNIYLLHDRAADYGPEDMIERGQISKIGQFIDMDNYSTAFSQQVAKNSLDLVSVYIGFHHCPLAKRKSFISAISQLLKPGGKLILRDHNAKDESLLHVAALAHDTFNAGTQVRWQENRDELRHFYSIDFIINYLASLGLQHEGEVLYQKGDPTQNGLMLFSKI